jgi:hypothetical protein
VRLSGPPCQSLSALLVAARPYANTATARVQRSNRHCSHEGVHTQLGTYGHTWSQFHPNNGWLFRNVTWGRESTNGRLAPSNVKPGSGTHPKLAVDLKAELADALGRGLDAIECVVLLLEGELLLLVRDVDV